MGGLSLWHWLVVGIVILLLFGKGRFSDMMGDVAQGLKSFKKGMVDEDDDLPPRRIEGAAPVKESRVDMPLKDEVRIDPVNSDREPRV